jgi:hypothetical protein
VDSDSAEQNSLPNTTLPTLCFFFFLPRDDVFSTPSWSLLALTVIRLRSSNGMLQRKYRKVPTE